MDGGRILQLSLAADRAIVVAVRSPRILYPASRVGGLLAILAREWWLASWRRFCCSDRWPAYRRRGLSPNAHAPRAPNFVVPTALRRPPREDFLALFLVASAKSDLFARDGLSKEGTILLLCRVPTSDRAPPPRTGCRWRVEGLEGRSSEMTRLLCSPPHDVTPNILREALT